MSNLVKGKVRQVKHQLNPEWRAAIAEIERQITVAKRRVDGLETVLRNWTELRDDGMPWPGTQSNKQSRPNAATR